MGANLDDTLTIAGFSIVLVAVLTSVWLAPFFRMSDGGMDANTPLLGPILAFAAVVLPPLVAIGTYVAAAVLAARASGLTFYYPWVALVVGAAAWLGITLGIGRLIEALSGQPRRRRRTTARTAPTTSRNPIPRRR